MYLKTCLLILLCLGLIQARVYRKIPKLFRKGPAEELQVREVLKCYSCHGSNADTCDKKEKVCKQDYVCMKAEIPGYAYILQCASQAYYEQSVKDCSGGTCDVEKCDTSLCNE
ncbi:hypothetical protein pdam_00003244 [Pocillopora damicornis]|uniref:UPAR/Ly6 domain-containing protein n=1 Tax=Pocillopora damicornis TaxID=46731 RepID=A0A3M6TI67_POCDA|nr:uncharacterized protein LOC113677284 [Pocillopora damicornis]XP_027049878.1 uncharacterized protein LOC113677284 [Pocillopora damicornis]RMX41095.1 hypothetical protein pdam_00003244 [Pocillopora damicornis]